jgi:hypothetical protein
MSLDASAMYELRMWGGVDIPCYDFVLENHAPSKVIFFMVAVQSQGAILVLLAEETHFD